MDLNQFRHQQFEDGWAVLQGFIPQLAQNTDQPSSTVGNDVSLAVATLRNRQHQMAVDFLTYEQLHDIASRSLGKDSQVPENDLPTAPGVYVFVSLLKECVLKVGQTSNLRRRIGLDHLRYGDVSALGSLSGHYRSMGRAWPDAIDEDQIIAFILIAPRSTEQARKALERGLAAQLSPTIPG